MVSNQVKWAVDMYNAYVKQEGSLDAYVRGCHYFIVSLTEEKRLMPARKKGTFREYRNTKGDYKRLSELLVDARIHGLLAWDLVTDQKNEQLSITVTDRGPASLQGARLDSECRFDFTMEKAIEFDDMLDGIILDIQKAHFNNQTHRQVLIVEKAKARTSLESICFTYGTDFIQFGGQHSMTRLYEICQLAKKEGLPLRIFYLSDMDIAGWFMPAACLKRLLEIYPHFDHEVIRVGLSRKQILWHNLPTSFDVNLKKYPPGQVERFEKETGALECVEVDAMPKNDLLNIVRDQLETYAKLDEDQKESDELAEALEEQLEEMDLSDYEEKYNELEQEFLELTGELEKQRQIIDRLQAIRYEIWDYEETIQNKIVKELTKDDNDETTDDEED